MAGRKTAAAGCPVERAEFIAAAQALPAAPAPSGEAYWTQLHQSGLDTVATSRQLADQMATLGSAVDRIDRGYAALDACRRGRAGALRLGITEAKLAPAAGAQRLADEKKIFDAELAQGRDIAGQIASRQAILQEVAERMVAAAPGSSAKVAKAVAASPMPATPFMATQNAEIYARPDAGGARIADLRKGQRVQGPVAGRRPAGPR
ncbi:MAG: hypothetical protein WDN69_08285 [Aliidongia sp.]